MSEPTPAPDGGIASAFSNFAELADAAFLSAPGQALLRHVQCRIADALEAAGFQPAGWTGGPGRNSRFVCIVSETLPIADPLGGPGLNLVLEFSLMLVGGASQLHLAVFVSSTTEVRHLASEQIVYESWGTADLVEIEANFHESFHSLVAPEGIDDSVFSDVAYKLAFSLAP